MSERRDNKGFSGLSSLTSDIDETVDNSKRRNVQGEKPAVGGRSKDEQRPHAQESASNPRPTPPRKSEPEPDVVASLPSSAPASGSSRIGGFSGLSSLASDIDDSVGDSKRRNIQRGHPVTRGRGKGEQQPHPRVSAAKPRSAPPQPSEPEPEVVVSGTSRLPASGSSRIKWFLGLVGLGVLIWIFNVAQDDSRRPNEVLSHTQPSPSPSYSLSQTPEAQISDLEFTKPPVGENNILSVAQIRWCLREDIRIEVLRPMPTTNSQIDQFNAIVADYNSRCGRYRYRERTLTRAQQEVERVRAQIDASVSPPW